MNGDVLKAAFGSLASWKMYGVCSITPPDIEGGKAGKILVDPETGRADPPNDAHSRCVMTMPAALDVIDAFGPGFVLAWDPSKHPTAVAGDFDSVVDHDSGAVDRWSLDTASGSLSYVEWSPSASGLRPAFLDEEGHLKRIANGERYGVGAFGAPGSNRFVTLTGHPFEEGKVKPVVADPALATAILRRLGELASKSRPGAGASFDTRVFASAQDAAEAILDGSALHPARMHWMMAKANDPDLDWDDIEAEIRDLFDRSAAKGTPRWHTRMRGMSGVLKWAKAKHPKPKRPSAERMERIRQNVLGSAYEAPVAAAPLKEVNGTPVAAIPHRENDNGLVGLFGPGSMLGMGQGSGAGDPELSPEAMEVVVYLRDRLGQPHGNAIAQVVDAVRSGSLAALRGALGVDDPVVDEDEPEPVGFDPLQAPGLVGLLTRIGYARAMREMPMASFVGALAGISAVMGTRFVGEFVDRRSYANLFMALLAPTSSGKEDTFWTADRVHKVIEEQPSWQGLHGRFLQEKTQLMITDELGRWMEGIQGGNDAQGHAMLTFLMKLYARADGKLSERTYSPNSGRMLGEVRNPYMVMVGITAEESLKKGITPRMIRDGALNRFIYMRAPAAPWRPYEREPVPGWMLEAAEEGIEAIKLRAAHQGPLRPGPVTRRLSQQALAALRGRVTDMQVGPGLSAASDALPTPVDPGPCRIVPTAEATALMLEARNRWFEREAKFHDRLADTSDEAVEAAPLWARAYENSRRLAMVLAVGVAAIDPLTDEIGDEIPLTAEAMAYAIRVVEAGLISLGIWVGEEVSAGKEDAVRRRLMTAIRKHGKGSGGWVQRSRLIKTAAGSDAGYSLVKGELEGLVAAGTLTEDVRTEGRSRVAYYRLVTARGI